MKKIFLLLVFFLLFSSPVFAARNAMFEEANRLFDKEYFFDAIALYEEVLRDDEDNYEALWRISCAYNGEAVRASSRTVKKENAEQGEDYARQAVAAYDDGFEGHLQLARSLGLLSEEAFGEDKVAYTHEIEHSAEAAIACNPRHFHAYMILGIWHRKVVMASWIEKQAANLLFGGLPPASIEEAEANLRRSKRLNPDFIETRYELALVYKVMKEKELAIRELEAALTCPVPKERQKEIKKAAAKLLRKLK